MTRKKIRPNAGDPLKPGMSQRDIAAALGDLMSRRQIQQAIAVASIPEAEFTALIESDNPPTVTHLAEIGRGKPRPKKNPARYRAKYRNCPHCGGIIE